ncbi:MAG: hypothetical protein M3235_05835, partial [Actinomycetota bacterium]|nr:hypothetical protein [Actinomycetota bacterium]
ALPGREPDELPTLSPRALNGEGLTVIERRAPSLPVDDDCVLVTGEVDRTTEHERGMPPPHQAWTERDWQHDPTVIDDQALVVHERSRAGGDHRMRARRRGENRPARRSADRG